MERAINMPAATDDNSSSARKDSTTAAATVTEQFLTFEIAFNVIMPKGPLEAAFGF